ncbi:AbrB family transcriptional regulator [Amorphus sp. 3PC139-8]|uniref:AbrB family transcriptional regulator n=1 Tax=Amorphus sp. 3PC139-8 TaxID=2735676 RepID=UPI00345D6E3F
MTRDTLLLFRRLPLTLILALVGGGLFTWIGIPAGWLSGAAVAVAIAAISGTPVGIPNAVRQVAFLVLGIGMGSSVTPDTLDRIGSWPLSIVFVLITTVLVTAIAYWVLHRFGGWDRMSAFYGSVPGALSYVLAVAMADGVDMRRVALAQSVRLLFLVAVLPPLIGLFGADSTPPTTAAAHPEAGIGDLVLLVTAGAAAGYLFLKIGQSAGVLLGALLTSGILHVTGIVSTWMPGWLLIPGYLVLGGVIGTRFAGTDRGLLIRLVATSLSALLAGLAVALASAVGLIAVSGLPAGQVILALSPGALESMTTLAFLLGFDAAYVASLHFIRFIAITLALPWIANRFRD